MRSEITRPETRIIARSAQVAETRIQSGSGSSVFGAFPAQVATQEGTDDDGNIITLDQFLVNVDQVNDPTKIIY